MECDRCPAGGYCLGRPAFCAWAAEEPPDPVKIRTIRERSSRGDAPPPASSYPSAARMVGNALAAAGRAVAAAVTGAAVLATEEEQARRIGICKACDQYDAQAGRCRACGCAVALKARLQTEEGQCPLKKW